MTADLLALAASDPAAFILRAADLREQRAEAAHPGGWYAGTSNWIVAVVGDMADEFDVAKTQGAADAEHIAAEANPAHALAAVRRWRGVVERHKSAEIPHMVSTGGSGLRQDGVTLVCRVCCGFSEWPCPDLTETADEARAYLGGVRR